MCAQRRGDDPWDISERPHTRAKLHLLTDYFGRWLAIWNGPRQREWASTRWYVIDLFAGRGKYTDTDGDVSGSPLVYLERILALQPKLLANRIRVTILLVEKKASNYAALQTNVNSFLEEHPEVTKVASVHVMQGDCNSADVWRRIDNLRLLGKRTPMFLLVDPYGFAIKRQTMERLMETNAAKDILFNYMVSGVKRAQGIAAKPERELTGRERTTLDTYTDFLGEDVCLDEDADSPQEYARAVFTSRGYSVAAYDMDYAGRIGTLYYLLLATENPAITKMARRMFGEAKKEDYSGQISLLGVEDLTARICMFEPEAGQ